MNTDTPMRIWSTNRSCHAFKNTDKLTKETEQGMEGVREEDWTTEKMVNKTVMRDNRNNNEQSEG